MPTVRNHDVEGLVNRINRFIDEIQKAASGAGSSVSDSDLARSRSYLDAVQAFHDYVTNEPQLDLPETHPLTIEVTEGPEYLRLENESLSDLTRLFIAQRTELLHSQSARHASGLLVFDSERLMAIVTKARNFLENYVSKVTPLDLPESSPMQETTPHGRRGA